MHSNLYGNLDFDIQFDLVGFPVRRKIMGIEKRMNKMSN
jgi:hypothetical protein